MRDPKRIDRILQKLATVWENNPDLRLCQLISNAVAQVGRIEQDVFFIEDDETEKGLDRLNKLLLEVEHGPRE